VAYIADGADEVEGIYILLVFDEEAAAGGADIALGVGQDIDFVVHFHDVSDERRTGGNESGNSITHHGGVLRVKFSPLCARGNGIAK
jgi:hypothetical protein